MRTDAQRTKPIVFMKPDSLNNLGMYSAHRSLSRERIGSALYRNHVVRLFRARECPGSRLEV